MDEIVTWGTDEIVCPHCGYEFDCSFEYDEDDGDLIECPECEKKMLLSVNNTTTYHTEKPDWLEQWRYWNKRQISDRLRAEAREKLEARTRPTIRTHEREQRTEDTRTTRGRRMSTVSRVVGPFSSEIENEAVARFYDHAGLGNMYRAATSVKGLKQVVALFYAGGYEIVRQPIQSPQKDTVRCQMTLMHEGIGVATQVIETVIK